MKMFYVGALVVTLSAVATAGQRSAAPGGAPCDRACLMQIADTYLAALIAHAPAKASLAPNVKFTEQTQVLAVGEGLWKTVTEGPTAFKIPVPDPVAGQIGLIVMLKANGAGSTSR